MKVIAGLGNPGFRYRNTKHNIGFLVLDVLAKRHRCAIRKKGFHGIYGTTRVGKEDVILLKPLTYMNLSGLALEAVVSAHLEDIKDLLVVSDDTAIPIGSIRLREKGSAGGHNGLASIIQKIGREFNRLRVGIGRDIMPEDRSGYVLAPFTAQEKPRVNEAARKAVNCVETWLEEGVKVAMNRCNV